MIATVWQDLDWGSCNTVTFGCVLVAPELLQNPQRIFPSPAARPLQQQQRTEDTNTRHQSWNFAFGIRRLLKSPASFVGSTRQ